MDLAENLRTFLENGQDWERKNTSIRGVSIIKLPKTVKRAASLAIDVNPVDENGTPFKRRGLMIMSERELHAFRVLFENEKVVSLIRTIDEVIPEKRAQAKEGKEDIIEI